ncbi:capsule assembly Wzi family protein [Sediminibacterium soli]|uniref:capsule assembly Wzi family protein n=1 Tax=Sediminibacterium soli TaxID=2698829 RepID=UPI001F42867B|nr:capsule assembly Wzi family protein [Sediminibacterium soli]NCI48061.1 capsule assembly Wzi family protein [Sediminibacterium soli]
MVSAQEMHGLPGNILDLRTSQLLNNSDSASSFTINRTSAVVEPDSVGLLPGIRKRLVVLPLSFVQQFNSHHPYGWNDGAMIGAKGYQAMFSAGIRSVIGPVEIQLQPEFVFAANPAFPSSAEYGTGKSKNFTKLFPGQSYLQLNVGKVAAGVSSENMWWGPGVHSSLLMSNNAPGFPHLFFRSRKPGKTFIGSFEWQLMGGWLSADSTYAFENTNFRLSKVGANRRYLNSLVISYQPKWVPGLFLGFTRSIQTYTGTNSGAPSAFFERYFPVLALSVQKNGALSEDSLSRDQLASFFFRWVFPKAHFEVYAEYGFNDYGVNFRDYAMGPSHSAAYLAGFRKIIPRSAGKRIELGLELTQMSQTPDWMVRNAGNWYVHGQLVEGYTHYNQILGAGAGYGANVLSVDMTWVNGPKRLGFILERINRDPVNRSVKWVDLGLGVAPRWQYRQFVFSGLLQLIKTNSYIWQSGNSVLNMHARLAIQYNIR